MRTSANLLCFLGIFSVTQVCFGEIEYDDSHLRNHPFYFSFTSPKSQQFDEGVFIGHPNHHPSYYSNKIFGPNYPGPAYQYGSNHYGLPDMGHNGRFHKKPFHHSPSDFAKFAPPKAIMSTTADLLNYRGKPLEMAMPRRHGNTMYHKFVSSSINRLIPKRHQTISLNNGMQNGQFSYNSNNLMGGNVYNRSPSKLKSHNSTEYDSEDEDVLVTTHPFNPAPSVVDDLDRFQIVKPSQSVVSPFDGELDQIPKPDFTFDNEDELDDIMSNRIANGKHYREFRCPDGRHIKDESLAEVYPDPMQCDQFYYCKFGRAYVFKCPVNNFFNPVSRACEVDEDFACAMNLKKKK